MKTLTRFATKPLNRRILRYRVVCLETRQLRLRRNHLRKEVRQLTGRQNGAIARQVVSLTDAVRILTDLTLANAPDDHSDHWGDWPANQPSDHWGDWRATQPDDDSDWGGWRASDHWADWRATQSDDDSDWGGWRPEA